MKDKKTSYMRRAALAVVFLLAALLFSAHYASAATKAKPAGKPGLNRTSITCNISDSYNLKLKNVDKKKAKKIRWVSSRPSVIRVTSKGKAVAKNLGKAVITAKYKGKRYKCRVTVKKANYTVSVKSKSFRNKYKSKHSSSNRNYYMLRSYLERLEKTRGGTLTLKAGTYKVKGILFIPSNVTVRLSNGVTIQKYKAAGTNSLFHFVSSTNSYRKMTGYNGTRNSKLVGYGKAVIDLRYVKNGLAIAMGHNKNITVSGITFQNMYGGHFIELDANYNAVIKNCRFVNAREVDTIKEGINLDIPDRNTGGFGVRWSSQDRTVNKKIEITGCEFINLDRAIGTHAYVPEKFFTGVSIHHNYFGPSVSDPIRICNWSKPVIQNNTFECGEGTADRAVYCTGVISPVISNNVFNGYERAVQVNTCKNSAANPAAAKYKQAYNILSKSSLGALRHNQFIGIEENYARIRYNETKSEKLELFPAPDQNRDDSE